MLPQYVEKQLTLNLLTDDIVNTALEAGDYEGISTETARQACYQWMSHSAVWNEELAQFTAEYCQSTDSEPDDLQVLDAQNGFTHLLPPPNRRRSRAGSAGSRWAGPGR